MPTPTISEASPPSASSSAMSSVVAEVSTRSGRTPSRSRCSVARAVAAVDADDHVAGGRAAPSAEGSSSAPRVVDHHDVGRVPGARQSASAPRSTPTSTGPLLADEGADPRQLGAVLLPVATTTTRRAGRRSGGRLRGSPVAVEQQVLLAAEELGAVVGEGLELRRQAGAGRVHLRGRRASTSTSRPSGDRRAVDVAPPRRGPGPAAPSGTRSKPSGPTLSTIRMPASASSCRAQVGVAAGDHRRGVEDGRRPRRRRAPGRWRGPGRGGRGRRCRRVAAAAAGRWRTAVDAGGPGEPGVRGGLAGADWDFMTAPWCQPGRARDASAGRRVSRSARAGRAARAARGRGRGRCRTPRRRRASATARARGRRRRAQSRPEVVTVPSLDLCDHDVAVGVRRDLGQVGDHQHLRGAGQPRPAGARPRWPPCRRRRRRPRRRRTSGRGRSRRGPPRAPASPGTAHRRRRPCAAGGRRRRCWRRAGTRRRRRRARRRAPSGRRPAAAVRRGVSGAGVSCCVIAMVTVACGMAREVSSALTARPSRRGSVVTLRAEGAGEVAELGRGCGRARPPARRSARRCPSRSSSRFAPTSAQASTSSIVSPYLRVSAVSAARRSETAASRAGSVSRPAA